MGPALVVLVEHPPGSGLLLPEQLPEQNAPSATELPKTLITVGSTASPLDCAATRGWNCVPSCLAAYARAGDWPWRVATADTDVYVSRAQNMANGGAAATRAAVAIRASGTFDLTDNPIIFFPSKKVKVKKKDLCKLKLYFQ